MSEPDVGRDPSSSAVPVEVGAWQTNADQTREGGVNRAGNETRSCGLLDRGDLRSAWENCSGADGGGMDGPGSDARHDSP